MNPTGFVKHAAALIALALCSACAGGSAVAPASGNSAVQYVGRTASVNGRLVTAARPNPHGAQYRTIVSELTGNAKSKYFEYIINFYGSYAGIFHYPIKDSETGEINDVGGQGCTNVLHGYGRRTIWIMAAYNDMTEYVVPHKPIETLPAVSDGSMPSSCAMDTDGDLAVGILDGPSEGDVLIFKHATGSGTFVKSQLQREYFDGYDDKGNLFFDGFTSQGNFALVELPKGSTKTHVIETSNTVQFPGSVQWDGTYLTVFDQLANEMYQYTVSGTTATLQHTISFVGSSDCAQTWIATGVVYCGDAFNNNGEVFAYPAGGSPIAVFTGNFDEPLGTVAAKSL